MIGTLQDEDKCHWRDFIPILVHAYNCMKSNATEFSPYYLVWKLKLGLDLQFGLHMEKQLSRTHHNYVTQLEDRLCWTYKLAQET